MIEGWSTGVLWCKELRLVDRVLLPDNLCVLLHALCATNSDDALEINPPFAARRRPRPAVLLKSNFIGGFPFSSPLRCLLRTGEGNIGLHSIH